MTWRMITGSTIKRMTLCPCWVLCLRSDSSHQPQFAGTTEKPECQVLRTSQLAGEAFAHLLLILQQAFVGSPLCVMHCVGYLWCGFLSNLNTNDTHLLERFMEIVFKTGVMRSALNYTEVKGKEFDQLWDSRHWPSLDPVSWSAKWWGWEGERISVTSLPYDV